MGFVVRVSGSGRAVKVFGRFLISISTTTLDLNLLHGITAKIDLQTKSNHEKLCKSFFTFGPMQVSENCVIAERWTNKVK